MKNFSFNNITKDYLYVLEGNNRIPWAPVERVYQEVPNRPGAYSRKRKKTKPRPLPIPVAIKANNLFDIQLIKEDFAAWLIQNEPKPLVCDDEPNRTYYAEVNGSFDPDEFLYYGIGVIPFVCPDPYKYGTEKSFAVGSSVITNEGSAETNPIFTVTFTAPASELKILHQESGKYVRVIWSFVAGDTLVIDLKKRSVTINNSLNMTAYDWRSQPFNLKPSVNSFAVTPTGVATTNIKFNPRWL